MDNKMLTKAELNELDYAAMREQDVRERWEFAIKKLKNVVRQLLKHVQKNKRKRMAKEKVILK